MSLRIYRYRRREIVKMKRTLTALTVAATMFASSASALDPADLQKLKDKGTCRNCDLRGAILSGAILRHANLSGANLEITDLRDADLMGANLRGASLSGANLSGADLTYVTMTGAILCNTTMPDGSVIYSGC